MYSHQYWRGYPTGGLSNAKGSCLLCEVHRLTDIETSTSGLYTVLNEINQTTSSHYRPASSHDPLLCVHLIIHLQLQIYKDGRFFHFWAVEEVFRILFFRLSEDISRPLDSNRHPAAIIIYWAELKLSFSSFSICGTGQERRWNQRLLRRWPSLRWYLFPRHS